MDPKTRLLLLLASHAIEHGQNALTREISDLAHQIDASENDAPAAPAPPLESAT
jgi:hypothetical protein